MASTAELKHAYNRSRLWHLGYTFKKAIECEITRQGLECLVKAQRRKAQKQGHPAPIQPELI